MESDRNLALLALGSFLKDWLRRFRVSSSSGPFSRFGVEPGVMEGVPPRGVVVGVVAVRLGRP